MSNGVDFRKLALDLREQLTTAQCELGIWKTKACEAAEREAALREELAEYKNHQEILLKGARYARSRRDYWIKEGRKIFDRLTAAEQRNAVMSKLLQRCIPVCRYKGSHTERALINEIETVLTKPTESGASE